MSDWNNFISARGNLREIISKSFQKLIAVHEYFCNMFSVAEIILKNNFIGWNNFISVSDVVTCKIKHWNDFEIILVFYFTCNHGITVQLMAAEKD